ncbi:MAG: hypothetical protein NW200_13420 [Hyphomonadaceae bacterium]|nr:hypothetical protein [Hyphomonadaceae bacterium]
MTDVYVAFVRDDQAYAEALAVALQGSGFTVSRSASVVEAIETCGAIVVLWTPAAARSKLFIDAADRAFRAGKMVLARMGQDPLPPMFAGTEVHSLARWSGDPESPEIDSIVFHVDRLINRGRPPAGAPPQPDAAPETAHPARGVVHPFPGGSSGGAMRAPRPAEAPRAAPPQPTPQPYQMAAPADPLAEEAAYWRRIQHATDPGEFYAYLDRYGRNGAFAELAEARVRALTVRPGARPPVGAPLPQAMPAPMPHPMQPPMQQPPMQGPPIGRGGFTMNPPVQRAAPARAEPPPLRAPVDPEAAGARSGGGMRGFAFLLFLAIIGGGGYYIYTQLEGPAVVVADGGDEPWTPPANSPAEPEATLDEALVDAPTPPSRPAAPTRAAQAAPTPEPEPPIPAPVFRTLPPAPPPPAPAPAVAAPAASLQNDVGPVAIAAPAQILPPSPPPAAKAGPTVRPRWARRPSERDMAAAFPANAQRLNIEGRVVLDCLIGTDLAVRCRTRSETPAGYGFGAAALRVAQQFRAAPTLMDGRPAAGERAQVSLIFKPE